MSENKKGSLGLRIFMGIVLSLAFRTGYSSTFAKKDLEYEYYKRNISYLKVDVRNANDSNEILVGLKKKLKGTEKNNQREKINMEIKEEKKSLFIDLNDAQKELNLIEAYEKKKNISMNEKSLINEFEQLKQIYSQ